MSADDGGGLKRGVTYQSDIDDQSDPSQSGVRPKPENELIAGWSRKDMVLNIPLLHCRCSRGREMLGDRPW